MNIIYFKMNSTNDSRKISDEEALKSGHTELKTVIADSGGNRQFIAAFRVNLAALACGVFMSWPSSAKYLIKTTESEWSWICALLNLGACCGAIPTGLISEHFGRRKTLIYLTLPMVISWILTAASPNISGLYVGRFVGGVAMGAVSVAIPPYVADICETKYRDAMANIYHSMFAAGIFIGYVLGALVSSAALFSVLACILPLIFCATFLFLPESPVYLMTQGKVTEAMVALKYFRGTDTDVNMEITSMTEYIKKSLKNKATFADLVNKRSTVRALIVAFVLMIFQQLCGVYPIVFYTRSIFTAYEVEGIMSASNASVLFGVLLLVSTLLSTIFLSLFPRRFLLIVSFFMMAVCTGTLGIYYQMAVSSAFFNHSIELIAMLAYISMYSLGVGPIPWLILRQIFPPNITRRATAIMVGFHYFLAFVITKLYQNLLFSVKLGWLLLDFSSMALIGMLFVYFIVPETKDRNYDDIHNEFEGVRKKHTHMIEVECECIS